MITINLDGDGCWPDLAEKMDKVIHVKQFSLGALEAGTTKGNPSMSIRIDLPDGRVVIAEATMKEFLAASEVMKERYGDKS